MTSPKIGIIGPRRVRQGLGPFVARYLHEAGATVCCFLSTTPDSRDAAERELQKTLGLLPRGYVDLAAMLEQESLAAVAILSPAETHGPYLEAAVAAGLHVLCEKPLVWGAGDIVRRAQAMIAECDVHDLLLVENCQWPYTLQAYRALHPVASEDVTRFDMQLSPMATGTRLLADALPHPLSLLQAIAAGDDARLDEVTVDTGGDAPDETRLGFRYIAGARTIHASIRVTPMPAPPRRAGYALNGLWANRLLRMADYAIFFSDGLRVVDVPDPLQQLIQNFVYLLQSPSQQELHAVAARHRREILQRIEMLHYLRTMLPEPPT